jgi:hypothetical protein
LTAEEDEAFFGPEFARVRDELVEASELRYALGPNGEDQYSYRWEDNPAAKFNIRGAAQDPFKVRGLLEYFDRMDVVIQETVNFLASCQDAIQMEKLDSSENQES